MVSKELVSNVDGKLKSTTTRRRSSKSTGRKSIATETFENATQATSSESIASSEVSPVRIFPMPEEGQDWTGKGLDCSLRPFAWFENCNPERLCWRTWQRCLLEGWTEFLGRWPRSGTMRNGIVFRLPPLVPRISGTGCSSLRYIPTPKRLMPDNLTSGTLNDAGRIVRKSGNDYGINLADWVRLWPTPTSLSPPKNGYNGAGNSCGLVAIKQRIQDEDPTATGQLNPQWVEWLMGFPQGWTDLDA